MKRIKINSTGLLLLLVLLLGAGLSALAQEAEKTDLNLNLRYYLHNNKIPYLQVETNTKVQRKFEPVAGIKVQVFLNEVLPENRVASVITDAGGKATITIPPAIKDIWNSANQHTFIGVVAANRQFNETITETEITKARLAIATDTIGGTRNVRVTLQELKDDNSWAPVEDAELKVGIKRLNTVLPVGPDDSYTTDEDGIALAEFAQDRLPGDNNGNLTLIANLPDSDAYGTLTLEHAVPWGIVVRHPNDFEKRSLFATRDKAPYWLLFLSAIIFFTVWGTIVYLAILLIKIIKLGKTQPAAQPEPAGVSLITPLAE